MKLPRIGLVLLLIVLLPALIYTAYEFTSLNENERLISEIYDRQMDAVLFSVNQYSWDISNRWIYRLDFIYNLPAAQRQEKLQDFFKEAKAIHAVFFSDSLAGQLTFQINPQLPESATIDKVILRDLLLRERALLARLLYRKKVGYAMIEPLILSKDTLNTDSNLTLLFAIEAPGHSFQIGGMILDPQQFIAQVLRPKMNEYIDRNMSLGIFQPNQDQPEISVGEITRAEARLTKKIWLFPNHVLGIKLSGVAIEDVSRNRFYRSLILISFVDVILIAGAWIVYRNIRRESQLARMKTDFVSNVSHELRTPLALIRMFAETLEMGRVKSDERRQEYYQIIMQEAGRLTHLINNILDFSRMEAGKKQYHLRMVDLNEIIRQIMQLYRFHLENKQFVVETELSRDALLIQADEEAITEAIINLIDNAMKYSAEGKHIAIRSGMDGSAAFVEVEDHGIGIAPEDQKKIFEKFYRVSGGLTHNTKGSGLGLSLVDFTMKAHGGRATLKSELGKGSRFRLAFPLNKKEQS